MERALQYFLNFLSVARKNRYCPCGSGKRASDCCLAKGKAPSGPKSSASPQFWIPSLALCAIPLFVIARSMKVHDYAHNAYWAQNETLNALSTAAFILAGLLALIPPLRHVADRL